jgi:hypothetical protein
MARSARLPVLAGAAVALLLVSFAPDAHAMRCGNRLISTGDPAARLLAECGEPVQVSYASAVRRVPLVHRPGERTIHLRGVEYREVAIETWVYNFGPSRFMREVRLEDGRVESIRRLGRGYRERD